MKYYLRILLIIFVKLYVILIDTIEIGLVVEKFDINKLCMFVCIGYYCYPAHRGAVIYPEKSMGESGFYDIVISFV